MKRVILFLSLLTALLALSVAYASASDGYVSGGGHILEAPDGAKRPEWLDVSFGGWIQEMADGSIVGEWQVNFHNVTKDELDQSHFHATTFSEINFFGPSSDSCQAAVNFTAHGSWNGMPGYKMIFRAGDFSTPNSEYADTIRVELFGSDGKVYDTSWSTDFDDESDCVGTARTGLDTGNLTIVWPSP